MESSKKAPTKGEKFHPYHPWFFLISLFIFNGKTTINFSLSLFIILFSIFYDRKKIFA
jgi:hypothetical protein